MEHRLFFSLAINFESLLDTFEEFSTECKHDPRHDIDFRACIEVKLENK